MIVTVDGRPVLLPDGWLWPWVLGVSAGNEAFADDTADWCLLRFDRISTNLPLPTPPPDTDVNGDDLLPWLRGVADALGAPDVDTVRVQLGAPPDITVQMSIATPPPAGTRYHVQMIPVEHLRVLPKTWVLPWLRGVAAVHDAIDEVDALPTDLARESQRLQGLRYGESKGWFVYQFVKRGIS